MKLNWIKLLNKAQGLREKGMTLKSACNKVGISTNSYWRWNNGYKPLKGNFYAKIVRVPK